MKTRFPIAVLGLAAMAAAAAGTARAAGGAGCPNILLIFVDDQRNDTLGCAGHPVVQTPNIDRLAAQGVRFVNAFVQSSMCMPSRLTLFTSLAQRTHGGVSKAVMREDDLRMSYPAVLRAHGYRTGF